MFEQFSNLNKQQAFEYVCAVIFRRAEESTVGGNPAYLHIACSDIAYALPTKINGSNRYVFPTHYAMHGIFAFARQLSRH
jgi:hypothetical protein